MSVSRASRPFMLMQKRQAKPDVPSRLCVGSGARHATAGNRSSNSASDLLSMSPFLRLTRRIRAMLWVAPKPDTGVSTSLVDPANQPKRLTKLYNPCWLISARFSTGKPAHVRIYLTRAPAQRAYGKRGAAERQLIGRCGGARSSLPHFLHPGIRVWTGYSDFSSFCVGAAHSK